MDPLRLEAFEATSCFQAISIIHGSIIFKNISRMYVHILVTGDQRWSLRPPSGAVSCKPSRNLASLTN